MDLIDRFLILPSFLSSFLPVSVGISIFKLTGRNKYYQGHAELQHWLKLESFWIDNIKLVIIVTHLQIAVSHFECTFIFLHPVIHWQWLWCPGRLSRWLLYVWMVPWNWFLLIIIIINHNEDGSIVLLPAAAASAGQWSVTFADKRIALFPSCAGGEGPGWDGHSLTIIIFVQRGLFPISAACRELLLFLGIDSSGGVLPTKE